MSDINKELLLIYRKKINSIEVEGGNDNYFISELVLKSCTLFAEKGGSYADFCSIMDEFKIRSKPIFDYLCQPQGTNSIKE